MTDKNKQASYSELWFTIFLGALLIGALVSALGFSSRARVAPLGVSVLGLLLVGLQLIKMYSHIKKSTINKKQELTCSPLYKIIMIILLYPLLSWIAGYLISTFIVVWAGLYFLNFSKRKWSPLISALVSAVMYVVFELLVQVQLPGGFLNLG